jgi:hypothetical protein
MMHGPMVTAPPEGTCIVVALDTASPSYTTPEVAETKTLSDRRDRVLLP